MLDPARERELRARRLRTLNTRTIPLLRLLGGNLLVVGVVIHNGLILGAVDWGAILWLAGFVEVYCLATWLALERWYDADGPADLGLVFLIADLLPLALAVYVTGATGSWIFWVFLFRVVDQTSTHFRRAFMFMWLGVLAYAAVIGWVALVDGGIVHWPAEAAKLLFLVIGGGYMSLTARTAERVRSRLAEAVRTARESVIELREQSEELERARMAAEAGSRAKSQFLSRVSHELRTPMNAILGFAQLLELEELTAEQAAHVAEIMAGGRHLLDIINDVLDLARVETGSLAREIEPVRLAPALAGVLAQARAGAERREVSLPDAPPAGCDVWVLANERKLRQVFTNLVDNAVRYNSSPGTVRVACERRNGVVRVRVVDTGPGIPADRLEEAFTPFERLGADGPGMTGAGLGLPVARSLLDAMHGRIGVDSEPGVGTTCWFELMAAEPPTEPKEAVVDETEGGGPLVLYIDDKPENVVLVRRILSRRPAVRFLTAAVGREGLELARDRSPDLILLDLELPDIPGADVLSELLADDDTRDIPVVVVSAEAAPAKVERLLADGARAYFTMPYSVNDFLDVVDELLELD